MYPSQRDSLLHVISVYDVYSPYAFDRRVQGLFGGPCFLKENHENCNLSRWAKSLRIPQGCIVEVA